MQASQKMDRLVGTRMPPQNSSMFQMLSKVLSIIGLILLVFPSVLSLLMPRFLDNNEDIVSTIGVLFLFVALGFNFRGFVSVFSGSYHIALGIAFWGLWTFSLLVYLLNSSPSIYSLLNSISFLSFYPSGDLFLQEASTGFSISWPWNSSYMVPLSWPIFIVFILFALFDLVVAAFSSRYRAIVSLFLVICWTVLISLILFLLLDVEDLKSMFPNLEIHGKEWAMWLSMPLIASIIGCIRIIFSFRESREVPLIQRNANLVIVLGYWILWILSGLTAILIYLAVDRLAPDPVSFSDEDMYELSPLTHNWLERLGRDGRILLFVLADDRYAESSVLRASQERSINRHARGFLKSYAQASPHVWIDYVNPNVDSRDLYRYDFTQRDRGAIRAYVIDIESLKALKIGKDDLLQPPLTGEFDSTIQDLLDQSMNRKIKLYDMVNLGPQYEGSRKRNIASFEIEHAITKACRSMLGGFVHNICIGDGLGSLRFNDDLLELRELFERWDMSVKHVPLFPPSLSQSTAARWPEISEKCHSLILPGPVEDFPNGFMSVLDNYLGSGGHLLLTLDAPIAFRSVSTRSGERKDVWVSSAGDRSNMKAFLSKWGILWSEDLVAGCQDDCDEGSILPWIPLRSERTLYTRGIDEEGRHARLVTGRFGTTFLEDPAPPEHIAVQSILRYTSFAYKKGMPAREQGAVLGYADMLFDPSKDLRSSSEGEALFPFALAATRHIDVKVTRAAEDSFHATSSQEVVETRKQHVIVVGDSDWLRTPRRKNNPTVEELNPSNALLIYGLLTHMRAQDEEGIDVPPIKELKREWDPSGTGKVLDLTSFRTLYYFVVPLVILLLGFLFVFVRRRVGPLLFRRKFSEAMKKAS